MGGKVADEALLWTWFSRDGRLDRWCAAHPSDAVSAGLAWRDAPLEGALPYGEPGGSRARARTFDWEADSAIVVADFRRLYGIDLRAWQAHWYDFCALWCALAATDGSLVAEAMRARTPAPAGSPKPERDARRAAARAWALPPTDDELEHIMLERIRREW